MGFYLLHGPYRLIHVSRQQPQLEEAFQCARGVRIILPTKRIRTYKRLVFSSLLLCIRTGRGPREDRSSNGCILWVPCLLKTCSLVRDAPLTKQILFRGNVKVTTLPHTLQAVERAFQCSNLHKFYPRTSDLWALLSSMHLLSCFYLSLFDPAYIMPTLD